MFSVAVMKFLKAYWMYIVAALIVVALVVSGIWWYNNQIEKAFKRGEEVGVAAQYKKDKETFDEMQRKHDERVKALEELSKKLGNDLDTLRADSASKIQVLDTKLAAKSAELNRTMYNKAGKPITCPQQETEFFLGKDFSDVWNAYTTELMH